MSATAVVIDPAQESTGPAWWFLGTLVVEHRMASGGGPVVLETTMPRGAAPPLHVHADMDDSWYLLTGQMVVRCGERLHVAGPGDWVSMPRGIPHAFRVVGHGAARVLMVEENESFLELVRDLGRPAGSRELPPPADGPPLDELSRAMAAHDVTAVGASISEEEAQAYLAAHAGRAVRAGRAGRPR